MNSIKIIVLYYSQSAMANKVILHLITLELKAFPYDKGGLRKQYLKLMQIWHPDKHIDEGRTKVATQKAQQLNEAYEYLTEILENHNNSSPNRDTNISEKYKNYKTRHTY